MNTRNQKIRPQIHLLFSFCSATRRTKRRTDLLGRSGYCVWLINGQLPIKAECRDAPLALRDFSRSNRQKPSGSIAISLHWHPHLHQSILPILSCKVKLIFPSQLLSFSTIKGFLVSLTRFHIEWFQHVYLFNNLFFDIWRVADIRKRFWTIFFPYQCLLISSFAHDDN